MRTTTFKTSSDIQHIRKECQTLIVHPSVEKIELELDNPRVISIVGLNRNERKRQWHLNITNKGNLVLV